MDKKVFALVDCNAFFCSCEQVFAPHLRGRPVIVLSNNDGCAVARTREAKKLGIAMAAPFFQIKDFCKKNSVAVFSSNFSLYTDLSKRVMQVVASEARRAEIYSVDEAFLDLTGLPEYEWRSWALALKKRVFLEVGIPVSIGIASSKVLAKAANVLSKKNIEFDGVLCLATKNDADRFLELLPVEDIWGIGRSWSKMLKSFRIITAKDFRDYPNEEQVQKLMGVVGINLKRELQGESVLPLTEDTRARQQILCSRTFKAKTNEMEIIQAAIASFASSAAEKLRADRSLCSRIDIFLQVAGEHNYHHSSSAGASLEYATMDTRILVARALSLLKLILVNQLDYRKAGVVLSKIISAEDEEIDFFQKGDSERERNLMKVIDKINMKNGPETMRLAVCGTNNFAWEMKRQLKSPRYTTSWLELMRVK